MTSRVHIKCIVATAVGAAATTHIAVTAVIVAAIATVASVPVATAVTARAVAAASAIFTSDSSIFLLLLLAQDYESLSQRAYRTRTYKHHAQLVVQT